MNVLRIVPDIASTNLQDSKRFYTDFIGLKLAMDMGWIMTFNSKTNPTAQVTVVHSEKPKGDNSNVAISIEVSNVSELYQKALTDKLEVIYQLTDEEWGVRRFFVKDPNGVTVNILSHIKEIE